MRTFPQSLSTQAIHLEPDYERLAQLALASSGFQAIRALTVEWNGEALVLNGKVATFYQKQIAQALVMSAAGSVVVLNEIKVP